MKKRDLGCIDEKLLLFLTSDTLYCICSFESTLLSTHKIILEPKKVLTTAAHTESTKRCKKSINKFYEGRSKSIEIKYLMIESILSPLFYLHSPSPPPCIHNIHKRLFHQICSHSPFRYQDELLMCLSAASQMCKVRQHSAHLRKNALSQTNVLISDVFSPSSVLTGKCNFKLELGLTHVKTLWKDSAKVDITLLKASCLHQS